MGALNIVNTSLIYATLDIGAFAATLLIVTLGRLDNVFWLRCIRGFLLVSLPWAALDVYSHSRGWWSYNPDFIFSAKLFGLPLEEIAFFFVVPMVCTALYELIRSKMPVHDDIPQQIVRLFLAAITTAIIIFGLAYAGHERTLADSVLSLLAIYVLWNSPIVTKRYFWLWAIIVLPLFLVFNGILTALPIVIYNESFMTGWRVASIPIEDFLYNYSFLILWLIAFTYKPRTNPKAMIDNGISQR